MIDSFNQACSKNSKASRHSSKKGWLEAEKDNSIFLSLKAMTICKTLENLEENVKQTCKVVTASLQYSSKI